MNRCLPGRPQRRRLPRTCSWAYQARRSRPGAHRAHPTGGGLPLTPDDQDGLAGRRSCTTARPRRSTRRPVLLTRLPQALGELEERRQRAPMTVRAPPSMAASAVSRRRSWAAVQTSSCDCPALVSVTTEARRSAGPRSPDTSMSGSVLPGPRPGLIHPADTSPSTSRSRTACATHLMPSRPPLPRPPRTLETVPMRSYVPVLVERRTRRNLSEHTPSV